MYSKSRDFGCGIPHITHFSKLCTSHLARRTKRNTMKTKFIIITIISLILVMNADLFAQKKKKKRKRKKNQTEQVEMDLIKVQVDGLGCPFCAFGLEKKLKEIEGLRELTIDMETGITSCEIPSYHQLTVDDVLMQVEQSGYTPRDVTIRRADGSVLEGSYEVPVREDVVVTAEVSFKVGGKCGMCKRRIEQAALAFEGVASASWDVNSHLLDIAYNEEAVDLMTIKEKMAEIGHDTDETTADDAVYKSLPDCCLYNRKLVKK